MRLIKTGGYGFGAGSFPFMGFSFSAHNGIIEDICSLGIFGILLTIFIYISIFSQVKIFNFGKNNVRNKWFYFVPILVPIGGSIFLHSIRNIPNYTMILIGFLLCDTIVKSKVTINEKVSAI